MTTEAVRMAFTASLLEAAKLDKSIFALATDSRGSVTLTDFADQLPDQFVECGIAEQNAVGISAGLANAGLRPFLCGPACFYSMRSAEQIKVDIAYSHMNVKVIGVSGGVSYGALGTSHHATQDIALMRAIPSRQAGSTAPPNSPRKPRRPWRFSQSVKRSSARTASSARAQPRAVPEKSSSRYWCTS